MRNRQRFVFVLAGILLAATAAVTPAAAQDSRAFPRFRFGVAGGANFADMSKTDNSDIRTGVLIGGSMMIELGRNFAIQPELYFSQKGAKGEFTDDNSGESIDITLKNDYIELPVLARWTFGTTAMRVRPFVVGGPTFAFVANCKAEGRSGGASASVDCTEFADQKDFDFGGVGGAGLEFPVGRSLMSLGARYTMGFNEVFKGTDAKNRTASVLVGITF